MSGGFGSDTVQGAGATGDFEFDQLRGDDPVLASPSLQGNDTFILGNATTVFYDAAGVGDLALIVDFELKKDKIQLNGAAAASYRFADNSQTGAAEIYLGDPINQELIGAVEGVTVNDLFANDSFILAT